MAALIQAISSATPVEMGIVVCIVSTLLFLFWTLTR
jgi:competence protein ComGC